MEPIYLSSGQWLNAHSKDDCTGPCPLHAPSSHHMLTWVLVWRNDTGILERICPHEIGHPDPDTVAFLRNKPGTEYINAHGCDGCCDPITSRKPHEEIESEADTRSGDYTNTPE